MENYRDSSVELLDKYFEMAFSAPDGIKRLRELILTLAMQGKLIEQDPNDKQASELLKEIEAEKRRLIKEGKIKKSKPLPEITVDEIPYDLPESWEWVRLGKITEYNGRANVHPKDIAHDTWLLDLEDIEKDSSRIIYRAKYSERESKSTKSIFEIGDVLYGKLRPYLNKVVVADNNGVCTTEIVPIIPYIGVDSYFLKLLLKRPAFLAYVDSLMYGVKMPRLGTDDAIESIHPLPPLEEQHRIVAKIDRLMEQVDRLEKLQAERDRKRITIHAAASDRLLNASDSDSFKQAWNFMQDNFNELHSVKENISELRKAILQLAVMGKLVPQDPNDPPASELLKQAKLEKERLIKGGKLKKETSLPGIKNEEITYTLPENWEWVNIEYLVNSLKNDLRTGPFGSSLHKSEHKTEGIPVWGIESINKNGSFNGKNKIYVDKNKAIQLSSFSVSGGDIIMSRSGTIGELCCLPNDISYGLISTNLMKISLNKSIILPTFFCLLFKGTQSINIQLSKLCAGSTRLFLTQSILLKLIFPLPPLPEQHRIVAKVDRLMAMCDRLEQQLNQRTEKQNALLEAVLASI